MSDTIPNIEAIETVFDDPNAVANAGLLLVARLAARVGLGRLVDSGVTLKDPAAWANAGSKMLTLVFTLIVGGTAIDHANLLRAGDTSKVLGFKAVAPSTLGSFLRGFTHGHISQLHKVCDQMLANVWNGFGTGPGSEPLVIDIDSTVIQTFGHKKQGVTNTYRKMKGYHPLLAARSDTREILHARLRGGASQKGHDRFIRELVARVRRSGACGGVTIRMDSGFWSLKLIKTMIGLGCNYSITVKMNPRITAAIEAIPDESWTRITYPDGGIGEVASCVYEAVGRSKRDPVTTRLVVRRTRRTDTQDPLFMVWDYHAFVTNLTAGDVTVDAFHRKHAVVELVIRDLKHGAGAIHMPSGSFNANAAWLTATVMAHNLVRWTQILGDPNGDTTTTLPTFRTRVVSVPGRLVNLGGRFVLRLPKRWPFQQRFTTIITNITALPMVI